MRPLIVDLGREYRGGQHQALLLLQGLLARGHAPELLTLKNSLLARRAKEAGIPVHSISTQRRRIATTLNIRRLVGGRRVDVVHANEPHALSAAWFARAHRSIPVIASRRIALPLSKSSISLARYRAAARIVAVSHFVEKSVIESGLSADRIEVIYDGVEIPPEVSDADRAQARSHFDIPFQSACIGNIAAFVPEKGHAILLQAFAELRSKSPKNSPGYTLLLCGKGPGLPYARELAGKLQILDSVKFVAPVSEIEKVLAAMDIFAFPSHEEPLGSALLAAMARGLPVVAVGRGGVPEVVENGKNGLLVESLDPAELTAAMEEVLENPENARRLGKAARESAITRFSADGMVDAVLRLYESLSRPSNESLGTN